MTPQWNLAAIPFGLAAIISGVVGWLAWMRRARQGGIALTVAMVGEMGWAIFEAAELSIEELPIKQVCFALRTACISIAVLGSTVFVLEFTGKDRWLSGWRLGLIVGPPVLLTGVAWTNAAHHWYWSGFRNARFDGHWVAVPTYGPALWLHLINHYVMAMAACVLLMGAVTRTTGLFRAQAAVMLFGVMLPWVVNVVDLSQVLGYIYVDTAAITFAVTGMTLLPGLYRFRLLDLVPVAWETVVRDMDDPVMVIDPFGRVLELNARAEELVGMMASSVTGLGVEHVFANWKELGTRLSKLGGERIERFELQRGSAAEESDGNEDSSRTPVYDVRISRLGDPARLSGWVVVLREITDRKRAEEERLRSLAERAALAESEAANRAKDGFLAMLSHELRTPLTPVLATVTAMLDERSIPSALRHVLEMIRRNVLVEAALIDDLLDLTRIRGGRFGLETTVVDVHDLINRVVEKFLGPLQSSGIVMKMNLAATGHHIEGDARRLEQVLRNLLQNVHKFTPNGGAVTIRTRNAMGEGVNETAGYRVISIEVSDTGIGIDRELLPRIFEVFERGDFSANRRHGGLGLGLTICRSIVEAHGGRLTARSGGHGLGATFGVTLPVVEAIEKRSPRLSGSDPFSWNARTVRGHEMEGRASFLDRPENMAGDFSDDPSRDLVTGLIEKLTSSADVYEQAWGLSRYVEDGHPDEPFDSSESWGDMSGVTVPATAGGDPTHGTGIDRRGIRILLVEDNSDTLNYLTRILRNRGHEVRPACDLSTALKMADQAAFDVLVSDIELPDGSGLELMWQLRARGHVAGIAVSGFGSPEDIEMSRAAGFADHLTKPIDFRKLEATIQRLSAEQGLTQMIES